MIHIYVRDGDAEDFDRDDAVTAGDVVKTHRFTHGEELDAAALAMKLLSSNVQFDVRSEVY